MKTYNPSEEPSFMLPVDDADVAQMVRDTERRMARKLKRKVQTKGLNQEECSILMAA